MRNKDTGQCNEEVNEPLIPYNNQLAALLKNLTRDYIDAEFFLADSHSLFNQMIWYPGQYGKNKNFIFQSTSIVSSFLST